MQKILFFLAALFITATAFAQDQVPSISVTKLNGEKVDIQDVVKETDLTIISFWATWCAPCRKELENIVDLYPEWQENYNVQLVAISIDDARTKSKVKPYVDGQGFEYLVVMDQNKDLFHALNGINPPLTLIINKEGKILEAKNGYIEGDEYVLEEKLEKYSNL